MKLLSVRTQVFEEPGLPREMCAWSKEAVIQLEGEEVLPQDPPWVPDITTEAYEQAIELADMRPWQYHGGPGAAYLNAPSYHCRTTTSKAGVSTTYLIIHQSGGYDV